LIVVTAIIAVTDTVRIADEETSHLVLNTEVYHLAGGFVPHISDTAFRAPTYFILGTLQLLPATGILLAVSLRLRQLAHMLVALPLETADTTPGDNHGLACVRADGGKVDFAQVYRCVDIPRGSSGSRPVLLPSEPLSGLGTSRERGDRIGRFLRCSWVE